MWYRQLLGRTGNSILPPTVLVGCFASQRCCVPAATRSSSSCRTGTSSDTAASPHKRRPNPAHLRYSFLLQVHVIQGCQRMGGGGLDLASRSRRTGVQAVDRQVPVRESGNWFGNREPVCAKRDLRLVYAKIPKPVVISSRGAVARREGVPRRENVCRVSSVCGLFHHMRR